MTWRVTPSSVNSALRNSYEPREEPVACLDVARCRAIGGDPAATCACFAMPRPSGVPNPSMFSERVLDRKKILITGGGTGIGKSLGSRFLGFGAEIVICGRREEILRGTVAEWTKSGGKASYFVCDIRLPDKVEAMFEEIWRDRPLDGLVNNTAGNFIARTETLSPRAFDSVINARHRLLHPGCRPAVDRGQARGYDPFDLNQLSLARQSLHGSVGKPPRLVCFPWCGAWLPNGVPRESALSWSPLDSFLPPARRRGATWTQQNTKRRSRASLYGEWDGTLSSPIFVPI
jgi:hypothetical protein